MGDVRRKMSRDAMPSTAPAPQALGARSDVNQPAERRFEEAKTAAMQRAATNTAMLDSLSTRENEHGVTRRIGTRIFKLRDSVWTDARYVPTMRTIRVKPFSPLYFALVQRLTGLGDALVVGERAIVAGRAIAIAIVADGAEQMGERDVAELTRLW